MKLVTYKNKFFKKEFTNSAVISNCGSHFDTLVLQQENSTDN